MLRFKTISEIDFRNIFVLKVLWTWPIQVVNVVLVFSKYSKLFSGIIVDKSLSQRTWRKQQKQRSANMLPEWLRTSSPKSIAAYVPIVGPTWKPVWSNARLRLLNVTIPVIFVDTETTDYLTTSCYSISSVESTGISIILYVHSATYAIIHSGCGHLSIASGTKMDFALQCFLKNKLLTLLVVNAKSLCWKI